MSTRPTLLRGGRVIDPYAGIDDAIDVLLDEERATLAPAQVPADARIVDVSGQWVLPGLVDLQVHFREPGQTHKEDLRSGSRAAFAGGVSSVVCMPNTRPVLDDPLLVRQLIAKCEHEGLVRLFVAAAATAGSQGQALSSYAALAEAGAVAVTDDGLPILDDAVMADALRTAQRLDLLVMQHAEDTRITHHVPMTACGVSERAGIDGQPPEAESNIVERDVRLAEETGARYHVLHLSTRKSLEAVRAAKARGAHVTCEVSPHHLLLTHDDVVRSGVDAPGSEDDLDPNKKMNPPLRSDEDRRALVAGLADGTVDAVATDHAPHHADEKGLGFKKAPFGVTGLETMFAAVLRFVHDGTIDARRAVELCTAGPARVLGRAGKLGTLLGLPDACVVDPRRTWEVTRGSVLSMSKNSCFYGWRFTGRVTRTYVRGRCAFELVA